jgi:hypothetical protein
MPYLLILLAVVARLLVHPFNFTPIGGIGLFAGSWCSPRVAWLMPLATKQKRAPSGAFFVWWLCQLFMAPFGHRVHSMGPVRGLFIWWLCQLSRLPSVAAYFRLFSLAETLGCQNHLFDDVRNLQFLHPE